MKVLSFLEMWHLTTEAFDEYRDFFKNYATHDCWAHFLAQPFKLELIDELFEALRVGTFDCFQAYPLAPRTLDEFITDCQRAGINLEWREHD
jgi:hypothetical protein